MSKKRPQDNRNPMNGKHASKKEMIMGGKKKSPFPLILIGSLIAAVLILAGAFVFSRSGEEPAVASATEVVYPTRLFEDGQAKYYQYASEDGKTIKYFILKSSDGVIRAAFDACDVCWPAGKGYYQEGDFMVCRNCGRRFASVKVNEVKGGCNPAPLARTVAGGNLVIKVKDILSGKQYFDFSKRS